PTIATIASAFSVAYSFRFIHQVFFGPPATDLPKVPHEPTRGMLVPSALLVVACLLVGIFPARTVGPALENAMLSILGGNVPEYELAVWHGLTAPLLMSFVALAGGVAFYLLLVRRGWTMRRTPWVSRLNASRMFDVGNVVVVRGAARVAHFFFT